MDEQKQESAQEEEVTLTPDCGSEETAAPEVQPAQEAPAEKKDQPKPGMSAGKIALLVALAVAAIAVVVALVWNGTRGSDVPTGSAEGSPAPEATEPVETTEPTIPADGNPDDVTCKGTYYVDDDQLAASLDTVVATIGDQQLTNRDLQVYYWMSFYDFLDMYGNYIGVMGMDPEISLDMQKSIQEGQTWQQFLLGGALENWHNYTALGMEARATAFELDPEIRTFLDNLPEELKQNAEKSGFESVEDMIRADMGTGADLEGYLGYMEHFYLGDQYYRSILRTIGESLDEEMLQAYFDEHAEQYGENGLTQETRFVNARHILVTPEGGTLNEDGRTKTFSDEEWEACRVKAQGLLDEFLAGEQTEERFAELAAANSEDPGSKGTGGLYEDMYEGQMVPPFEEWCFDTAREYGDTGLVKTDYGYHVMYYVSSRPAWIESTKADLTAEKAREKLKELVSATEMQVDYDAIALGRVELNAAK